MEHSFSLNNEADSQVCLYCRFETFFLPCRDDTPHVPNEDLGERAVLDIVGNLTQIIDQVFPGKCEPTEEHQGQMFTAVLSFSFTLINIHPYPQTLRCTLPWVITITTPRTSSLQAKASFMKKLQKCGRNG